jgi:hypothetical protein
MLRCHRKPATFCSERTLTPIHRHSRVGLRTGVKLLSEAILSMRRFRPFVKHDVIGYSRQLLGRVLRNRIKNSLGPCL